MARVPLAAMVCPAYGCPDPVRVSAIRAGVRGVRASPVLAPDTVLTGYRNTAIQRKTSLSNPIA
jgi:hypothetical protein